MSEARLARRAVAATAAAVCAIAAPAAPAGAAWTAPFDLSPLRTEYADPAVGIDGRGNSVTAWSRIPERGASRGQVAFRTWRGRVRRQTLPQAGYGKYPSSDARRRVSFPDVAVNGRGESVAAWTAWEDEPAKGCLEEVDPARQGDSVVQGAIRRPGGRFGAPANVSAVVPVLVITPPQCMASDPPYAVPAVGNARVAIDDAGNAVVAWSRTEGDRRVVEAAYRPAGGTFGPPQTVAENGVGLQLAANARGDAILAWTTPGDDLVGYAVRAPGRPFGPPQNIEGSRGSTHLDAAMSATGTAGLAWQGLPGQFGGVPVYAQFRTPDGTAVGPKVALGALSPQLEIDGRDRAVLVTLRHSTFGVDARRAAVTDPEWGAPELVSRRGRVASNPVLALSAQGRAVTAWRRLFGNRNKTWIEGAAGGAGGFGPSRQLAAFGGTGGEHFLDIAMNAGGQAVAVWERIASARGNFIIEGGSHR